MKLKNKEQMATNKKHACAKSLPQAVCAGPRASNSAQRGCVPSCCSTARKGAL